MKKILALLLALVLVFSFAACSSTTEDEDTEDEDTADTSTDDTEEEDTSDDTEEEEADYSDVLIGVMLSGSAQDGGWSQMAAEAAEAAAESYPGATVNYSESLDATDYESVMRGYADAGYTIIVAHGAEFLDTSILVAQDYPDCIFINTSAQESGMTDAGSNITGIDFATYELGFLVGVACASVTETKLIGAVGSNEIDSIIAWVSGVEAGAKYIDEECEVIAVYTGSYDDALIAKQCVDALVEQGVDVITQNADACGAGAVEECDELGIKNVGCVSDQTTLGDSCFISVIQDAQLGIEVAIEKAIAGELESGFVTMGATDGVIYLSDYSGTYADAMTDEQKEVLQALWQECYDGDELTA